MQMANSKKLKPLKRQRSRRSAFARAPSQNTIDRIGSEKLLSRGETVFRKGQSAAAIYKVESGCIKTYSKPSHGRQMVIAFYFAGDYFGLELRKKHIISAEAITPSMILVIRRKALTSRAANDTALAKYMLAITNVELQRAQNHSLLLRDSAHDRVANFLFEMKQRNRRKEVILLMSRQEIADYLNLTIETVSRALKRLKKKSAISHLTWRRVTVHLRKRLAA
jgi:CRP/FNR family transcriptional regulator, nitrogen fixation regulation protein